MIVVPVVVLAVVSAIVVLVLVSIVAGLLVSMVILPLSSSRLHGIPFPRLTI